MKDTFVRSRKHAVSLLKMLIKKINVNYRYKKLRHVVWVKGRVELSEKINSELSSNNDFHHLVHNVMILFRGTREV